jgi:hypothetical protein
MRARTPTSRRLRLACLLCASLLPAFAAGAQVADPVPGNVPLGDVEVRVEFVVQLPDSGSMSRPRARPMILSGDGSGRRFVADQNGIIYQIHPDASLSVFLDVAAATDLVVDFNQRGVSSFAFHPDFSAFFKPGYRKLYTATTQSTASGTPDFPVPAGAPTSHHTVIEEWEVMSTDPDAIDPASRREVLRIGQPYDGHEVGQIGFDPNVRPVSADYGLLYIAMGDGGADICCPPTIDPLLVGQDRSSPLGTLLRIDPLESGPSSYSVPASNPFVDDGDPATLGEIWAYGLRNPHRFAFDTGGDGKLLISDIGASNIEEIDLGQSGANYGWSEREGTFLVMRDDLFEVYALPPGDDTLGYTYPVIQYDHDEGDVAISSGYVYRGARIPPLEGAYVFGDLVSGRIFSAPADDLDGTGIVAFEELRLIDAADSQPRSLLAIIGGGTPAPRADLRFGLDDDGEIYLLTKQDGSVRRLTVVPPDVPSLPAPALALVASLLIGSGAWILRGKAERRLRRPR